MKMPNPRQYPNIFLIYSNMSIALLACIQKPTNRGYSLDQDNGLIVCCNKLIAIFLFYFIVRCFCIFLSRSWIYYLLNASSIFFSTASSQFLYGQAMYYFQAFYRVQCQFQYRAIFVLFFLLNFISISSISFVYSPTILIGYPLFPTTPIHSPTAQALTSGFDPTTTMIPMMSPQPPLPAPPTIPAYHALPNPFLLIGTNPHPIPTFSPYLPYPSPIPCVTRTRPSISPLFSLTLTYIPFCYKQSNTLLSS